MARHERLAVALRSALAAAMLVALAAAVGGHAARPRSFVLVVLDTMRADAASLRGADTPTPVLEALARRGLRFERAYAQAHWTLPSHVTLFTGLIPSRHGVDVHRMRAPDDLLLIAESFAGAGYETFGVSENPLLGKPLNLAQGFGDLRTVRMGSPDLLPELDAWLERRDRERPFFLFLNLMDAHAPYEEGGVDSDLLPAGVSAEEIAAVTRKTRRFRLCETTFDERERSILWGQYLGGVAAADAKLGRVLDLLRARAGEGEESPLVVVTSDHGESLGEHGLLHHDYGLGEELLRVPLVVAGLRGVAPATIATPVALADVAPSLRAWAGLPEVPGDGRVLPAREAKHAGGSPAASEGETRMIVAEHVDPEALGGFGRLRRDRCDPAGPLFGDARAAVAGRWKLHVHEGSPPRLYDLAADPREERDLASAEAARVAELAARLAQERPRAGSVPAAAAGPPAADVLERLRALGYVGDPAHGADADGNADGNADAGGEEPQPEVHR